MTEANWKQSADVPVIVQLFIMGVEKPPDNIDCFGTVKRKMIFGLRAVRRINARGKN